MIIHYSSHHKFVSDSRFLRNVNEPHWYTRSKGKIRKLSEIDVCPLRFLFSDVPVLHITWQVTASRHCANLSITNINKIMWKLLATHFLFASCYVYILIRLPNVWRSGMEVTLFGFRVGFVTQPQTGEVHDPTITLITVTSDQPINRRIYINRLCV